MTIEAKAKYSAEFKENAVKRANESSNVAETFENQQKAAQLCVLKSVDTSQYLHAATST